MPKFVGHRYAPNLAYQIVREIDPFAYDAMSPTEVRKRIIELGINPLLKLVIGDDLKNTKWFRRLTKRAGDTASPCEHELVSGAEFSYCIHCGEKTPRR